MQGERRPKGAHALEVNTAGFWIRFRGDKHKRREPFEGTVRADVWGSTPYGCIPFSRIFSLAFQQAFLSMSTVASVALPSVQVSSWNELHQS